MYDDVSDHDALESRTAYHPAAVDFRIAEEKILSQFGNLPILGDIGQKEWIRNLIRCECLWSLCENKSSILADMVSVTSGDIGSALRKLRSVYSQTHTQMKGCLKALYKDQLTVVGSLHGSKDKIVEMEGRLLDKEDEVNAKVESRLADLSQTFEAERADGIVRV